MPNEESKLSKIREINEKIDNNSQYIKKYDGAKAKPTGINGSFPATTEGLAILKEINKKIWTSNKPLETPNKERSHATTFEPNKSLEQPTQTIPEKNITSLASDFIEQPLSKEEIQSLRPHISAANGNTVEDFCKMNKALVAMEIFSTKTHKMDTEEKPYYPEFKRRETESFRIEMIKALESYPKLRELLSKLIQKEEIKNQNELQTIPYTSYDPTPETSETENKKKMIDTLKSIDRSCSSHNGLYIKKDKQKPVLHFITIQNFSRRAYEALEASHLDSQYSSYDSQYQDSIKNIKDHYQRFTENPDIYCDNNKILKDKLDKLMKRIKNENVLSFPNKI